MNLIQIPPEAARDVWPLVRNRIQEATERSNDRFTESSILKEIEEKRQQLWTVWDPETSSISAVGVTQLLIYPSGMKVADVVILTGEGRKDWKHLVSVAEEWARTEECGLIQMYARNGWAKELKDYRLSHVLLEKKL